MFELGRARRRGWRGRFVGGVVVVAVVAAAVVTLFVVIVGSVVGFVIDVVASAVVPFIYQPNAVKRLQLCLVSCGLIAQKVALAKWYQSQSFDDDEG